MNVINMHLAVQQGVDKINSLQADMLLSEELDIELNKSLTRFINLKYGINNVYNKGFEESQKRIDDLRTLVTEYSAPTTYKEQYDTNIWVDTFRLPTNYLYLVSQRSEVLINDCKPLSPSVSMGSSFSYFIIPFTNFHNGATTFIKRMRMVADPSNPGLGDVSMLTIGDISSVYNYPADLDALQNAIQDPTNWAPGFEWYWEEYTDLHALGSFIVVVDTTLYPWFHYDSSITNAVSGSNLITKAIGRMPGATGLPDPINSVEFGLYDDGSSQDKRILTSTAATREYSLNKFVQHDDISKLLEDPFNTTKYTSPLTTIRGSFIDVYTSDIFIIDIVKITYIRKPKEISLSLGVSCELPVHCHQEIVDMTISSILEGISDPRYKAHQLEVSKNE